MFFNGSSSLNRGGQGQVSAPKLPTAKFQNPVPNDKNNQIVDFSNLGIGVTSYNSKQQGTPAKINDKYMSSAAKSMIGHSALVPVGDNVQNKMSNHKYDNPYETNLKNKASLSSLDLGSTN